jgi:mono/diheme cytochrome c family protein
MRRAAKVLLSIIVLIAVALAAAITVTVGWRPFIGPRARAFTNRTFERTPERQARGQYLVENLLNCFICHAERDWTKHDAPVIPGTTGVGPVPFPLEGLPGRIVAPNITPDPETGAGGWSDDQLARAIREGIGHDGRALFPMMPYEEFRHLSDEDLASVIVYLRSIPPVKRALPPSDIVFPVKYLIRTVPQPLTEPVPEPDWSTPESRGAYLVTIGVCGGCHTPRTPEGAPLPGMNLAGGDDLVGPWGSVVSANLTPDPSGISYYDESLFIETMRTGKLKGARQLNQIMPWYNIRNLTDDDLKDIFAYLRSIAPVQHRVDNTEPPTMCTRCGTLHGLGEQNAALPSATPDSH